LDEIKNNIEEVWKNIEGYEGDDIKCQAI